MSRQGDRLQRVAVRGMQAIIAAILLWGLWTTNVSIVVNGTVGLLVTFLPGVLDRDYEITLGPWLTFLLTFAILAHTVGITGPYRGVWWWDNVTHTLSAAIVAVVGYATTKALDEHVEDIYLPPDFMYAFIGLFTLATGVVWELLEFFARELARLTGQDAVLIQYGVRDTILDLLFDAVGAIIAAIVGVPRVQNLIESIETALETRDRP
ncbi:hypothetical protein [Halanaeroarchaeum sulfurireducens]|uniref:Membrane-spanning protein n=1 Tax=Halanaeroarchaeum sulfurireducens TaxID=1604004 RepID=A0A0F7PBI0_9EURY|nr:hypothetical protein [Halanaeroarchaeum sulfurireducens]AKH96693.1 hypothetical protein HLASF_0181 [Halanaeroarchaeum sulfurireducens]ALG81095.1 hypothetical protein HLASA_0181 [Halanaeroarchaeum sulfurireducens]